MENIVYFQCNNWMPYPPESERLIRCFFYGSDLKNPEGEVNHSWKEVDNWLKENQVCANMDIYDMSTQYWITCKKEWLEKNFPELVQYASDIPKDETFVEDRKYFLKWIPENFGYFFAGPDLFNDDDVEEIKARNGYVELDKEVEK